MSKNTVKKKILEKVAKKKASKKKAATKKTTTEPTKMDLAKVIFKKHHGKKTRKEIVELFMSEAGLTQHGGNTYHFNIKKLHEAVEL